MTDIISRGIGGHHRGYRGKSDVWLTPPEIIQALGAFDLDPCAAPEPRPWQTATTQICDGYRNVWSGRVWLNPPYGPELGRWLGRLAQHGNGMAIAFARTETRAFFEHVWPRATALLFIRGRLHFHYPDGTRAAANAGGPSVLIAYGSDNAVALARSGIEGAYVPVDGYCRAPASAAPAAGGGA